VAPFAGARSGRDDPIVIAGNEMDRTGIVRSLGRDRRRARLLGDENGFQPLGEGCRRPQQDDTGQQESAQA
jgi:hypothetical protein